MRGKGGREREDLVQGPPTVCDFPVFRVGAVPPLVCLSVRPEQATALSLFLSCLSCAAHRLSYCAVRPPVRLSLSVPRPRLNPGSVLRTVYSVSRTVFLLCDPIRIVNGFSSSFQVLSSHAPLLPLPPLPRPPKTRRPPSGFCRPPPRSRGRPWAPILFSSSSTHNTGRHTAQHSTAQHRARGEEKTLSLSQTIRLYPSAPAPFRRSLVLLRLAFCFHPRRHYCGGEGKTAFRILPSFLLSLTVHPPHTHFSLLPSLPPPPPPLPSLHSALALPDLT
ncbi:hypothetical protein LY76DRAFT_17517 [Colletotrichum caudatum]|nr:hypothetical protein LY76DRAFT_17517 [Colletotrichum caudatum]